MRIAYKTAVTLTKPQHLSFLCIFSFNIDGWGWGGDRHLCRSQNDYAGRLGVAPTYLAHICLFEKKEGRKTRSSFVSSNRCADTTSLSYWEAARLFNKLCPLQKKVDQLTAMPLTVR